MARAGDPILAREVAVSIVQRLHDAGHIAYFAGGCVRDALLGLQPTDFDIATDAVPQRIRELFDHTAEVGAAFGVILVHETAPSGRDRVSVEVATFRSDGAYTDARRPDSVRFSDPQSDAARRDFTINAIFLNPLSNVCTSEVAEHEGGEVIDYVGGVDDLRARIVRAVGDPDQRLAEDHLRALRAIRFTARLGFTLDPATAKAITRHASELRGVSRERIGEELRRMLLHPRRAAAIALLQDLTLDAPTLNEPARTAPLTLLGALTDNFVSVQLALAAWAIDRAGASTTGMGDVDITELTLRWRRAICLSNEEADHLSQTLRGHQYLIRAWAAAAISRKKRWAGSGWFPGTVNLVGLANDDLSKKIQQDVRIMEGDGIGLAPVRYLTGNDLIAEGFNPGPMFRRVLEEIYDAQLEGKVRGRDEAMELARRLNV